MSAQSLDSEASYALNRCTENVVIHPVVIPELKFRDVQRQILAADLVERADDTALGAPVKGGVVLTEYCGGTMRSAMDSLERDWCKRSIDLFGEDDIEFGRIA